MIPEFKQKSGPFLFWNGSLFCLNGRDQPIVARFINIQVVIKVAMKATVAINVPTSLLSKINLI
ncbi:hypothetical protein EFS13_04930 [Lentilactobacillus buchneri]|nr:hypothetical protein [Lentilactobacillus buchneri]